MSKTHRTGPGFYPRVEFHVSGREIFQEGNQKSCSLQISLNKFCCVLVLRHYLFKRDRRPKDFPHLVHLWPSSSFSFCFSLLSSLTSGGGEISSSSSPGWLCCWFTPMFFLPSKNVGSPLKAMACSRSLIAASWKKRTWFYFWPRESFKWSTWTSAHLSEEWETRCWSRVDLREKVLLQWRHVSFGRTLTINRCWWHLWTSFEFPAGLLPSSLTCSLQPWALFPRPLRRPGWFRTWHKPCWMSFGGLRGKGANLTCSLVFFSSPSVEHAFEMSIKNLLLSHFFKSPHVNDVRADELFIKPREEGLVPLIFRRKIYPTYLRFWNVNLCSRSVFQIMRVICCVYVRLLVFLGCSSWQIANSP